MTASSIRTADIREEFIRAVVDGSPVTLKELALRHGRSYAALRRAASDGKWSEKAVLARAERDAKLAGKMAEQNAVTAVLTCDCDTPCSLVLCSAWRSDDWPRCARRTYRRHWHFTCCALALKRREQPSGLQM